MRRKVSLIFGLLLCTLLFAYSAPKLLSYLRSGAESEQTHAALVSAAVTVRGDDGATNAALPDDSAREAAPISVDFAALRQQAPDAVAWLYGPDSKIDDPVVQSSDNDYYLRRLPDGRSNIAGSLFLDYRCAGDFSSWNSIIYGHNMKNKTRFGSLPDYRAQEYYDLHPALYLLTTAGEYRLDLIAGYLTTAGSDAYDVPQTQQERDDFLQKTLARSAFTAPVQVLPQDRLVTLSTCAYDYENARFVLVGVLREL
jgi:sortase B